MGGSGVHRERKGAANWQWKGRNGSQKEVESEWTWVLRRPLSLLNHSSSTSLLWDDEQMVVNELLSVHLYGWKEGEVALGIC